jgi:hypothetical protein
MTEVEDDWEPSDVHQMVRKKTSTNLCLQGMNYLEGYLFGLLQVCIAQKLL